MEEPSESPAERSQTREEDDEEEEKTDILTCCSPTHVQESSELPVRRSHAQHEDDGGNKKDERTDRDHGESTENQPGSMRMGRQFFGYGTSEFEYRVVCPANKIGDVIGRGGSVINAVRRDTKAKIRVDNACGFAAARVIHVSSAPGPYGGGRSYDGDKDEMLCPAQDALFRIYHCITKQEDNVSTSDDKEDENKPSSKVSFILLYPGSLVGRLIGPCGRNIKQMRKDTGAQIDIINTTLPSGAFPMDECVQVRRYLTLSLFGFYVMSKLTSGLSISPRLFFTCKGPFGSCRFQ